MTKETLKRYVHSAVVTFISIFLPLLLLELQSMTVEDFQTAGVVGMSGVLSRLIIKALYEMSIKKK